jgi:hypothetical protein
MQGVCTMNYSHVTDMRFTSEKSLDDAIQQSLNVKRKLALFDKLLAAMTEIASGMGNLPIEEIGPSGVHGIHDGKERAIYLRFVSLARATIKDCTI